MKKYIISYIPFDKNNEVFGSSGRCFYGTMEECRAYLLNKGATPYNKNDKDALIYYRKRYEVTVQFVILQDVTHTKKEKIFKKLKKVWNKK